MFSLKFFNKLVFFLLLFFLINFFIGADDSLRKEDDWAQTDKKLHQRLVQQDQDNRSLDHSVEIVFQHRCKN